jgi:hypothetical protein
MNLKDRGGRFRIGGEVPLPMAGTAASHDGGSDGAMHVQQQRPGTARFGRLPCATSMALLSQQGSFDVRQGLRATHSNQRGQS